MGFFSNQSFESLEDLFRHQLKDLYDAEMRIIKALPPLIEKASCQKLSGALKHHLRETEQHVKRLELIFKSIEMKPDRETCDAMKGLISEAEKVVKADGDPDVIDAALIAAVQRIEHYEMSAYGTARTFARQLGHDDLAQVLQQSLDEEGAADLKLTEIAVQSVNPASVDAD